MYFMYTIMFKLIDEFTIEVNVTKYAANKMISIY